MPAFIKAMTNDTELTQRAAVVKRYKELLEQQRERFYSYLDVLDRQRLLIGSGSTDEITAYVELGERIVADIFSIQKTIDPLEFMYNAGGIAEGPYLPANDVPELKAALEELKTRAAAQSGRNRDLLSGRMADINSEIRAIKNNAVFSNIRYSLYQNATPSLIDVMG